MGKFVNTFGGAYIAAEDVGVDIQYIDWMAAETPHVMGGETVSRGGDPSPWTAMGVFHGMRAALPVMRQAGTGTIITISSGAATSALEGWSHYCASKAAALMLTRAADKENRDHGIRVMGLSPGTVATDMQHQIKASGMNPVAQLDWSDHIPPDWPARALAWMCTAEADGWLGQDISLRNEDIRLAVGLK